MIRPVISITIGLYLLFSPTFVAAQSASPELPQYEIQPGDSLISIAQMFNLSVEELISVNALADPDLISPGDVLMIPGMEGLSGSLSFHILTLDESISDLPLTSNVTQNWLIQYNHLTSPNQVIPGSELMLLDAGRSKSLFRTKSITTDDNLLTLAIENGNSPAALLLSNKELDSFHFFPGQSLFSDIESSPNLLPSPPVITDISIFPLPLIQGSTYTIRVKTTTPVSIEGFLDGRQLQFHSEEKDSYFAIQGIHALSKPGLSSLELLVTSETGETVQYFQNVLLMPGQFEVEQLTVDPQTIDPAVTGPENELIYSIISNFSPTKHWSGLFLSPAFYQYFNSLFGTRRIFNNNGEITFHAGVDYGGGITLPIVAPAPGKVVFAGPLIVRGNAVFIDHGLGVFSGFFHQNSLNVKVGDYVEQGQKIGEVGNTGRIDGAKNYYGAGAHLHWEVWANKVQVDPLIWLENEFPNP